MLLGLPNEAPGLEEKAEEGEGHLADGLVVGVHQLFQVNPLTSNTVICWQGAL